MILKNYLLGLLGFLLTCSNVFAQSVRAEIPYEIYAGKMIVKMIINGEEERFIFDTGAGQSSISYEYAQKNKLSIIDSMSLKDVTSTSAMYHLTQIKSVMSQDKKVNFSGLRTVIMPEHSAIIDCFNVVGILGSDMLNTTICTIDSKTKIITINDRNAVINESFRYAHNFSKKGHLPIFNVIVNGQDLEILMDSGSSDFMTLKQTDYSKFDSLNAVRVIKEGRGGKSMGLAGEIDVRKNKMVLFSELRVGPAKFNNVITETENPPHTLLGLNFLEYAKVVIDYPRSRVYYIPYSKEVIEHKFRDSPFGISVANNKLVIAHLWDDLEGIVDEGDIITHINGIETGNYVFCDVISGIDLLKGSEPKLLTIKTKKGKSIELEYKVNEVKI